MPSEMEGTLRLLYLDSLIMKKILKELTTMQMEAARGNTELNMMIVPNCITNSM